MIILLFHVMVANIAFLQLNSVTLIQIRMPTRLLRLILLPLQLLKQKVEVTIFGNKKI